MKLDLRWDKEQPITVAVQEQPSAKAFTCGLAAVQAICIVSSSELSGLTVLTIRVWPELAQSSVRYSWQHSWNLLCTTWPDRKWPRSTLLVAHCTHPTLLHRVPLDLFTPKLYEKILVYSPLLDRWQRLYGPSGCYRQIHSFASIAYRWQHYIPDITHLQRNTHKGTGRLTTSDVTQVCSMAVDSLRIPGHNITSRNSTVSL
jgi:hypothetical protein